jgi:hypothetical protein
LDTLLLELSTGGIVNKLISILLLIGALAIVFLAPPWMIIISAMLIIGAVVSAFFA